MTLTTELLDYLKSAYEKVTGHEMISDSEMNSSQAQYYVRNLDDNLIAPMSEKTLDAYGKGSGSELRQKMRALKSSSAMTYNMIGNDEVTIAADSKLFLPGTHKVTFEWQYKTIKNNPQKANLDAFLICNEEAIFCEMKMTEWLFNEPGTLDCSYLDEIRYVDSESYPVFKACADKLLSSTVEGKKLQGKLQQYDAFQMFKHTLAIYNYVYENKGSVPKKIRLVNVVWHLMDSHALSEDSYIEYLRKEALEEKEFDYFYEATEEIRALF